MAFCWSDFAGLLDLLTTKKSPFLNARKIFIGNIRSIQCNSTSDIERAFKKFGAIENIEICLEKFPANQGVDEFYAFVTFKDSKSALEAIRTSCMHIVPADTWKQPDYKPPQPIAENNEISLNCLSDDCLIELFRYIDLETLMSLTSICIRFNEIICQHISSIQPKRLNVCFNKKQIPFALNVFKKVLKKFDHASLQFEEPTACIPTRVVDIFAKNLNGNLKSLEFHNMDITKRMLNQMKPIFANLEYLNWVCLHSREDELNLSSICPKLKQLRICSPMEFSKNNGKWQSLKSVTFLMDELINSDDFPIFLRNNPQLEELDVMLFEKCQYIDDICNYSKNLKNLFIVGISIDVKYCRQILQLEKLTKLHIEQINFQVPHDYAYFINTISKMKDLEHFEFGAEWYVIVYKPKICLLPILGKNLIKLKQFSISGYHLNKKSMLAFLKMMPQLEVFKFKNCSFSIDKWIVNSISNLREEQAKMKYSEASLLKICVEQNVSEFENVDKFVKIQCF